MIKLMRVDDRLIHGQCMTVLVKRYEIKNIIVIDDFTASNPMLVRVFKSAVPKGINAKPFTKADAVRVVRNAVTNDKNTLVLARVPSVMRDILKEVPEAIHELNIASVQAKGADRYVTEFAHMTENEVNAVKEMADMGVHIYFNLVPGQTQVIEWDSIKNRF